ncbi:MAG: TonB-dependent receptor, partial [Pyrinomonadaceae bacterium]
MARGWSLALVFILSFGASTVSLAQQQGAGGLRGQLTDEFGGIVIGATVTATGADGAEKTAQSNDEGVYTITGLAPGKYTVRAMAPGFALFETAEIDVVAGRREAFDIKLSVALEREEVTVAAESAISTEAENNQSALVLKGTDLDALPDDPDDLAAALQALAGPAAGPNGGQIFIDGFTGGRLPPKESIREIRINQNPFAAEFDQLGFGRVEILTRPGTDRWRGQTSFSFSDESLNSRDPFAERRAPFQNRNFGANLSGTLIPKKLSFFIDFDKRDVDGNSVINASTLRPTAFDANGDPLGFDTLNINRTVLVPQRRTSFSPRFDYQLNDRHTLVGRYSYTRSRSDNLGTSEFSLDFDPFFGDLDRTFASKNTDHTFSLTETAILTPSVINETRFQYQHGTREQDGDISLPRIIVNEAFTGGGSNTGLARNVENRYELQNYTSFVFGTHSLKAGGRLRGIQITDETQQNFNGTFTFTTLDQFRGTLLGEQNVLPRQFSISGGNPTARVSQWDFGGFVQDDWRVRPNFTLSAGLRYERQTNIDSNLNFAPRLAFAWSPGGGGAARPKTVLRGGLGVFYSRFGESLTLQANRFDGINQQQFIVSVQDVPNCGTAADATCQAVRAEIETRNAQARGILSQAGGVVLNGTVGPSLAELNGFALPQTTRAVADDLQAPYTIQSVFSVERLLPGNLTVTASYINTRTLHVLRSRNINAPVNGIRPLGPNTGNVFQYESSGTLMQNQLIINANTRLNPKFSIFANYTLGKTESDTDGAGTFPSNGLDLSQDFGRASFDTRHRVFFGGSFTLPWDLRLNPFITAFTGTPFNITTGLDNNGDTLFTDRPAFATEATNPAFVRDTPFGRFDLRPAANAPRIPRNFGQNPGYFAANVRLSKTFSFGDMGGRGAAAAANGDGQPPQGGG